MKAAYTPNPAYPGNPFIEALPPMLEGQQLLDALSCYPDYSEEMRTFPAAERLQLLGSLYEVYQPLSISLQLYFQIYASLQHSFSQKVTMADVERYHRNYTDIQNKRITAATGGGNSFSVIGISGLGKSRALQQVLSLFPPVIEHETFSGKPFLCKQIPYITVQTPHDGSVKALTLDILSQIDSVCGTVYYKRAITSRLSTDMLVSQLSLITMSSVNLGLLVIDELQNISYGKSGGGTHLLNFLVQLINSARLSLCMAATPRVLGILQQEYRLARRATGFLCDRLSANGEFLILLKTLWRYQYTRNRADLTPEIENWLFRKTQGIPDILVKLLVAAQRQAILDGTESLTIEVLDRAYKDTLQMVDGFLADLNTTPKKAASPKAATSSDSDIVIPIQGEPSAAKQDNTNIPAIVADAKRQGVDVVEALQEYITEVSIK